MFASQEAFWYIDKDTDGKLGLEDVQQTLARAARPAFADAELAAMFGAADMDSSSFIDFVEFVAMMIEKNHVARYAAAFSLFLLQSSCSCCSCGCYVAMCTHVLDGDDLIMLLPSFLHAVRHSCGCASKDSHVIDNM